MRKCYVSMKTDTIQTFILWSVYLYNIKRWRNMENQSKRIIKKIKHKATWLLIKPKRKAFLLERDKVTDKKLLIEATKEPLTELVSQQRDLLTQNTYIELLVRLRDLPLNVIKAKCASKQKPDGGNLGGTRRLKKTISWSSRVSLDVDVQIMKWNFCTCSLMFAQNVSLQLGRRFVLWGVKQTRKLSFKQFERTLAASEKSN